MWNDLAVLRGLRMVDFCRVLKRWCILCLFGIVMTQQGQLTQPWTSNLMFVLSRRLTQADWSGLVLCQSYFRAVNLFSRAEIKPQEVTQGKKATPPPLLHHGSGCFEPFLLLWRDSMFLTVNRQRKERQSEPSVHHLSIFFYSKAIHH